MKLRKYSYVIVWLFLILTVAGSWLLNKPSLQTQTASETDSHTETSSQGEASQSARSVEKNMKVQGEEMVGVWVPYMALTTEEKTEAAFKLKFEEIVKNATANRINTLFVHVSPFADAFFDSETYPWSHILTGEQGKDPGFDPMAFMIELTHANGMEFHAWLNPLRIRLKTIPEVISQDHPYTTLKNDNAYYFMEYDDGIYFNPAYSYVRSLIAKNAAEITKKYDIDGIQYDDYFYPTESEELDALAYGQYKQNVQTPVPLAEWRKANINALISEVYGRIKQENPDVIFGISPQGNLKNNSKLYADVKTWCAVSGYIDYILPQIYYSYENEELGYSQALKDWVDIEKHAGLDMYVGLALYKAGSDEDDGTWLSSSDIISRQIREAKAVNCAGVVLYSYDYLFKDETEQEVKNAMATLSQIDF